MYLLEYLFYKHIFIQTKERKENKREEERNFKQQILFLLEIKFNFLGNCIRTAKRNIHQLNYLFFVKKIKKKNKRKTQRMIKQTTLS